MHRYRRRRHVFDLDVIPDTACERDVACRFHLRCRSPIVEDSSAIDVHFCAAVGENRERVEVAKLRTHIACPARTPAVSIHDYGFDGRGGGAPVKGNIAVLLGGKEHARALGGLLVERLAAEVGAPQACACGVELLDRVLEGAGPAHCVCDLVLAVLVPDRIEVALFVAGSLVGRFPVSDFQESPILVTQRAVELIRV